MTPGTIGTVGQAVTQASQTLSNPSANASSSSGGFANTLGNVLGQADTLTNQADAMAATYAAGGPVSVEQLMVAEQQASLAVDMVVQVRDRVVNAYQTIMNMQI